jgi:hypothetical protein
MSDSGISNFRFLEPFLPGAPGRDLGRIRPGIGRCLSRESLFLRPFLPGASVTSDEPRSVSAREVSDFPRLMSYRHPGVFPQIRLGIPHARGNPRKNGLQKRIQLACVNRFAQLGTRRYFRGLGNGHSLSASMTLRSSHSSVWIGRRTTGNLDADVGGAGQGYR